MSKRESIERRCTGPTPAAVEPDVRSSAPRSERGARVTPLRASCPTHHAELYDAAPVGYMSLSGGSSSIALDTANGDNVPLFGTAGTVYVHVYDGSGNLIGTVVSGSYSLLAKGGKPGLGP